MIIIDMLNDFLWGKPLIFSILFVGLFFTLVSGFFQFRFFGHILRNTFGKLLKKDKGEGTKGVLSPYEAVSTAIGGSVGVGNIGGVATAIATGGPGAVFWMWVCALFGMLIKMVEVTLAVHYRSTDEEGNPYGGPTYYMEKGLGDEKGFKAWLIPAFVFGVGIFSTFFITVQNYTVSEAVGSTFNISFIIVSVIYVLLIYLMISGGIPVLGKIAGRLVPVMCLIYLIGGLLIIFTDFSNLPSTFALIFQSAFKGKAAVGGFSGAVISKVIQQGVARAVYSNEAGWGTSPMIHSTARTDHPVKQGMWGSFEVFVDTILVCSITALLIINSGVWSSGATGATLTLSAFHLKFGMVGSAVMAVSVFLFGLTTSTGWYAYYEIVLRHLMKNHLNAKAKILTIYKWTYPIPGMTLTIIAVLYGMPGGVIWSLADISSGIPTFINIIVILCLFKKFLALLKDYKARYMGIGKVDPKFKVFYEDK